MNSEQLAYANQQLAGMLKSGIPLEGALRRLTRDLRRGRLKRELEQLEKDLAAGEPLAEAVQRRQLPPLYVTLLRLGSSGGRLPEMLGFLADYYQQLHLLGTRLRGLLVYPGLVLLLAFLVSVVIAWLLSQLHAQFLDVFGSGIRGMSPSSNRAFSPVLLWLRLWLLPLVLGMGILGMIAAAMVRPVRERLRWRLPGFREGGLVRLASSLALLLRNGCSLGEAFELLERLEAGTFLGREIARWHARLAAGHKTFAELTEGSRLVPPLFVWVVSGSGEDWARGFAYAAELYQARLQHWTQLLLAAILPAGTALVALVLLAQFSYIFGFFVRIWKSFMGGLFM